MSLLRNKKIAYAVFLLMLFSSITAFFSYDITVKADPQTMRFLIYTDTHYYGNGGTTDWNTASTDIANMSWDVGFELGDITFYNTQDIPQFGYYIDRMNTVFTSTDHNREDVYHIMGNADSYNTANDYARVNWMKYIDPAGLDPSNSTNNNAQRPYAITNWSLELCAYTVIIGNIVWVMCGLPWNSTLYTTAFNWYKDVVGYYSNCSTDYNIFMCAHHPIKSSGGWDNSWTSGIHRDYIRPWIENNTAWMDNVAFFNGHVHYDYPSGSNDDRNYTSSASYLGFNGAYVVSAVDKTHAGTESHIYFLDATEGSTTVTIGDYRPDTHSWDPTDYPGNTSFQLDYAFTLDGDPDSSTPEFQSINGQANTTDVTTGQRYFNWTKVTGATKYQLQISNSSDFGTTFFDASNITEGCDFESMPGGSYTEIGDNVIFYLPYVYNISWYGSHYYRVRAYTT